ncbi:hypothetical protein FA15DRAFT_757670 [Coprinopsis marcescibilis]|uniref:TPR-like protein n=1 Tax=Coprinopsis marcescibilis TaxID=230819 RepID=A0A5C3KR52_COPMA|nr:hypothetical protein FA15DRAFT_757670 [Coprinopsis marcescibilis]
MTSYTPTASMQSCELPLEDRNAGRPPTTRNETLGNGSSGVVGNKGQSEDTTALIPGIVGGTNASSEVPCRSSIDQDSNTDTVALPDECMVILHETVGCDPFWLSIYEAVVGMIVVLFEPLSPHAIASILGPEDISLDDVCQLLVKIQPLLRDYTPNDLQRPVLFRQETIREYFTHDAPSPYRFDPEMQHSYLLRLLINHIHNQLTPSNLPFLGYSTGEWDIFTIPSIPVVPKQGVPDTLWYSCHQLVFHAVGITKEHLKYNRALRDLILSRLRPLLEFTASTGKVFQLDLLTVWDSHLLIVPASKSQDLRVLRKAANSLFAMANCLEEGTCRDDEAVRLSQVSIPMYRKILSCYHDPDIQQELAYAIRQSCICFDSLERSDESLAYAMEAVGVARQLVSSNPHICGYENVLARTLRSATFPVGKLRSLNDAITVAEEGVAIHRRLAMMHKEYEPDLARSLQNLADQYASADQETDAFEAIEEALTINRRWIAEYPGVVAWEHEIGFVLQDLAHIHTTFGHLEKGMQYDREAINLLTRLYATSRTVKHAADLSWSLHTISENYAELGQHEMAVDGLRQAVEIRRELAGVHPREHEPRLSYSLHAYADVLGKLRLFEEALGAIREAIDIDRRRVADSGGLEPQNALAASCYMYGLILGSAERYKEAMIPALEAIALYRKPGAEQRYLGYALRHYAWYLAASGEYDLARRHAQEGIQIFARILSEWVGPIDHVDVVRDRLELAMLHLFNRLCKRRGKRVQVLREEELENSFGILGLGVLFQ